MMPRCSRLFLSLILILTVSWFERPALGVPANPEPVDVVQPDGTRFQLRVRGDEYFSWTETAEGHAVVKDRADGFWKYARPVAGKAEFRAVRGARVGVADPESLGLKRHAMPDVKVLREHIQQRKRGILSEPEDLPESDSMRTLAAPSSTPPPEEEPEEEPPLPIPVPDEKTVKNIVIMACFSNHWDAGSATVSNLYGRVSIGEYSNLFNQVGHSADGAAGSVQDYYREVSYGKLTLDSVITVWVRLPQAEAYYGNNRTAEMAEDAIDAADAAGFDFSQGDTDGDGWADCLTITHSGFGEESTGDTNHVWSIKGGLSSVVTKDGVKMKPYHTEPALRGSSGTSISRIGTICHELGHFFGLPDLYDYSSATYGLGDWCLMASGSWNGTSGTRPGHFSAWCKVFLGFAKATLVHSLDGLSLPRVEDNPVVGLLTDGLTNGEYFVVENRARVGFDNDSAIHPGMAIYHVYNMSRNNDLGTWTHPLAKMEEADGDNSLGGKTAQSESGDVWTSGNGLVGGFRDLTSNDTASAMVYQGTNKYVRTNSAVFYSYNRLSGFSAAASNMTCNAATLQTTPLTRYALATNSYPVSWAAASEAALYEIQEGARTVLTSFADGAEDEEELHRNWYVGGGVQRLVTNASYAGDGCYVMLSGKATVHALTLRESFRVTSNTLISFRMMSHVSEGNGYFACQVSEDGGETWLTLNSLDDYIDPWVRYTNNYAALSAAGVTTGETCMLRFLVSIENVSGWSSFPTWGFALDDISITGIELDGHGGWTALATNVAATSYEVAGKTNGTHAYRIRAYANGAWQDFGAVGEITIGTNHPPAFSGDPFAGTAASVGVAYTGTLAGAGSDPDANDTITFSKGGGPAWLSVASNGVLSGLPMPGDIGMNVFTVRVADLAGAYDEAQLTISVEPPNSAIRSNLVAYLPFDTDFLDYSGSGNHPAESNVNSRTAGFLGGNGYVLSSNGYLSLGMGSDFHFPDTTEGNAQSFSVSFWARIPAGSYTGSPPFIANKNWAANTNTGWALASGPGSASEGYFQMNFKESNANARDYDSTSAALPNGWHHFLVVFKRDPTRTCYTYIDGIQADSRAMFASGINIDGANLPVNIGQDGTGAGTRGIWTNGTAMMDDFAFWLRALASNEVRTIFTAGTNGFGMLYASTPPIVTNQTADLALSYNDATNLRVEVLSAATPTFQWRLEGATVSGATNSSHAVTNREQAASLSYDVIVSNVFGTTTSRAIVVTLTPQVFTVTVQTAYGVATPEVGSHAYGKGTVVTGSVTAADGQGTTQYLCLGWALSGNEPQVGVTTSVVLTVTNHASLTWLWTTNYWLSVTSGPNGSVNVADGWQSGGVTTQVTATADTYYHFTNWSGSASSSINPLELLVDGPKSITANFAEDVASNGTPHWWMALYELTNGGLSFAEAETNDADDDGMANWEESVANTIPTASLSRLEIQLGSNAVTGGGYLLSWPSASNRFYGVSWRTNLADVPADLVTNLTATPPMNRYTDSVHNAEQTIYYRVNVRK